MEGIYLEGFWEDWKIEKLLGQGAFGSVYKAYRTEGTLKATAAVKVIHIPSSHEEEEEIARESRTREETEQYFEEVLHGVIKEIEIMQEFKGLGNIVSIEDYRVVKKQNEFGWIIYIRMEELMALDTYLKTRSIDDKLVIKLGKDICNALEVCAKRGVIHRDIKPQNILVNEKFDTFKLGDFGIARSVENTLSTLSMRGTYNYMAPEVFHMVSGYSKEYNSSIDIYSLGIVLYRLLNENRLPFEPIDRSLTKNEREAAFSRRMRGEMLPIPVHGSDALKGVVLKACEYNAGNRYLTPTDLKNALYDVERNRSATESSFAPEYSYTIKAQPGQAYQPYIPNDFRVDQVPDKKSGNKLKIAMIVGCIIAGCCVSIGGVILGKALYNRKFNKNVSIEETTESETTDTEPPTTEPPTTEPPKTEPSEVETRVEDTIKTYDQALFYSQRNDLKNVVIGDTISFGAYEQDGNTANGKEEIEWLVLRQESGKALLLSKKALSSHFYHSEYKEIQWEDCDLRDWLNDEFYNDAFSTEHQSLIIRDSQLGDKVFLLTEDEAEHLVTNTNWRLCEATVYAKSQGAYMDSGNCWWWLRTNGKDDQHIMNIYTDGSLNDYGFRTYVYDGAVRPAIWVDLSQTEEVEVPNSFFQKEMYRGIVALYPEGIAASDADTTFESAIGPGEEVKDLTYTPVSGKNTGVRDVDVNMMFANALKQELESRGFQVAMLRDSDDVFVKEDVAGRAAAEAGAHILINIDCASQQYKGRQGAIAYIPGSGNKYVSYLHDSSEELADNILDGYNACGFVDSIGIENTDTDIALNWSQIPSVTLMLGNIENSEDETILSDSSHYNTMAMAIADGIEAYFD